MIDILMATYNGEAYVKEQIESIFLQSNQNWKLIIRDDCSDDGTLNEINKIINGLSFEQKKKISVTKNSAPTGSACKNFWKLLQESQGDYVMFSDQDDVWHKDKIEKTYKAMRCLERKMGKSVPLLVYTDLRVVDEDLNLVAPSFFEYMKLPRKLELNRLLIQNSVTGCTIMMNRNLVGLLKQVQNSSEILMHDHFAALTASVFGSTYHLKEPTLEYRQHKGNAVGASNARSLKYLWMRWRRGRKAFQKDLGKSAQQVSCFCDVYKKIIDDKKKYRLLMGYADILSFRKIKRVLFCIKNDILKYGLIRKVVQIFWI